MTGDGRNELEPLVSRYHLANHVFACTHERRYVLLDLKRDKYFEIETEDATALAPLISGWPLTLQPDKGLDRGIAANDLCEDLHTLLEHGLISPGPGSDNRAASPLLRVGNELPRYLCTGTPTLSNIVNFIRAWFIASVLLRIRRFDAVVHRVVHRRRRRSCLVSPPDPNVLRQLIETFNQLRPWFFANNNKCVRESLVLIEFLAKYDVYPRWVFGVRTTPFAAHCWVEEDGTVLNDSIENVGAFTPIMAVE